jgi:membrane protein YdbS with pleckstrin-like domain
VLTGPLWTVLFPMGAILVHPTSPWVCAAGTAVVAVAIIAALWPAQRRYLAKMRASGSLQPTELL